MTGAGIKQGKFLWNLVSEHSYIIYGLQWGKDTIVTQQGLKLAGNFHWRHTLHR